MLKYVIFFLSLFDRPSGVLNQACRYLNSNDCTNHGKCTRTGTCLCDLFFYGINCESSVDETKRVKIVETGISQSDLTGIIIGWMFGLFFIIGIVFSSILCFCYCKKRSRQPDAAAGFNIQTDSNFPNQILLPAANVSFKQDKRDSSSLPQRSGLEKSPSVLEIEKKNIGNADFKLSTGTIILKQSHNICEQDRKINLPHNLTFSVQSNNNYVTIAMEENIKNETPNVDDLIEKCKNILPYNITPISDLDYPEFFKIMSQNSNLSDLAAYFESKLNEINKGKQHANIPIKIMQKDLNDETMDLIHFNNN